MTADEELAIIERVISGDTDAFEALVVNNQKKVYNLALKLTGNEDDALDASQEAFVRAFTGLGKFRGESRFSVWLYRLTYNICIDFIRKRQRAPAVSLTYIDENGDFADMELPDLRHEPAVAAEKKELQEAVNKGIAALPEKHREILVMRELTGMSYEDIASVLAISAGTVKSRLSRARLALAARLSRDGTFSGVSRQKSAKEVEWHE